MLYLGKQQVFPALGEDKVDWETMFTPSGLSLFLADTSQVYKIPLNISEESLCDGAYSMDYNGPSRFMIINGSLYYISSVSNGLNGIELVDDSGTWTRIEGNYYYTNAYTFAYGLGIRDGKLYQVGNGANLKELVLLSDLDGWTDISDGLVAEGSDYAHYNTNLNSTEHAFVLALRGTNLYKVVLYVNNSSTKAAVPTLYATDITDCTKITGFHRKFTNAQTTNSKTCAYARSNGSIYSGERLAQGGASGIFNPQGGATFNGIKCMSGVINWNIAGSSSYSSILFIDNDGYLFACTRDGRLYKVGGTSASNKWQKVVGQSSRGYSSPSERSSAANNRAMAIHDGKLYRIWVDQYGALPAYSSYFTDSGMDLIDDNGVWTDVVYCLSEYSLANKAAARYYGIRDGKLVFGSFDGVIKEYSNIRPHFIRGGSRLNEGYPVMIIGEEVK